MPSANKLWLSPRKSAPNTKHFYVKTNQGLQTSANWVSCSPRPWTHRTLGGEICFSQKRSTSNLQMPESPWLKGQKLERQKCKLPVSCLTLVRLDDARVCVRVGHPKMPCFIIISPVAIFVGGKTTMSFKLRWAAWHNSSGGKLVMNLRLCPCLVGV